MFFLVVMFLLVSRYAASFVSGFSRRAGARVSGVGRICRLGAGLRLFCDCAVDHCSSAIRDSSVKTGSGEMKFCAIATMPSGLSLSTNSAKGKLFKWHDLLPEKQSEIYVFVPSGYMAVIPL
jgi:hypothetical protein